MLTSLHLIQHFLNMCNVCGVSDRNHMILGNHPLSSLSGVSSVTSLLNTTFPLSSDNEVKFQSHFCTAHRAKARCRLIILFFHQVTAVGAAKVTASDIAATNGLIHVVDKVQSC